MPDFTGQTGQTATYAPTVPDLPPGITVPAAAAEYARCGWYVLPVDPATKHPGSLVGASWQFQSSRQPGQIDAWWQRWPDASLALHTGRSGAVAFDGDTMTRFPATLTPYLAGLAFQSTDLSDSRRGHYVAACTPMAYGCSLAGFPEGGREWGEVRSGNSVIIAEPTPHTREGGRYQWQRGRGELLRPVPAELAGRLRPPGASRGKADNAEVLAFLKALPRSDTEWCPKVAELLTPFPAGSGRYADMGGRVQQIVRLGEQGHLNVATALDLVEAMLYGETDATGAAWDVEGAWAQRMATAVANVLADPTAEADKGCCGGNGQHWSETFAILGTELAARTAPNGQNPPGAEMPAADPGTGVVEGGLPPSYRLPGLNLPDEFWRALPVLTHIRTAAWSRTRPADAVLGAVLARLAAFWPPWLRLDTGTDSPASANLFAVTGGGPGTGKSTSARVARDLLPALADYDGLMRLPNLSGPHPQFADWMPLGSGEGLAELFFTSAETLDAKGKPKTVKRKTRDHAFVVSDEGDALGKMLARSGATIGAALRSAWMGETIGQSNASSETTRIVPHGTYSLGVVIGFQPATAGPLLDDLAAGTPQRFAYFSTTDPLIPEHLVDWPGELAVSWPGREVYYPPRAPAPFPFAGDVKAEIRRRSLARSHGTEVAVLGSEHEGLTRCKLAGLLAVLDGRGVVDREIWELTAVMWQASCAVRDWLAGWGQAQAAYAEQHNRTVLAGRQVVIEEATDSARYERTLFRVARVAGKHVHTAKCDGGHKRKCITNAIASRDRQEVSGDEVIARLLETGVIEAEGDGYKPGQAAP